MYLWACFVALLIGSHASGKDCPSYFNECMAKGKGRVEQRGIGQSYQQCVEHNRREFGWGANCVSGAAEKAISEKACSCNSEALSMYKAYPALTEPVTQAYCFAPTDIMAPSCDRSVLQCYLNAVAFRQSLHAGPYRGPDNAMFANCSADQRGKLDKVKSCIADLKNKDLSGCGFLNYWVTNLHTIAVEVLKYFCTGCNMETFAKSCLGDQRIPYNSPSGMCNTLSEEKMSEMQCMQNQMKESTDCANLNVADTVKVVVDSPLYRIKEQICGTLDRVTAEYKTWGCPAQAKGKGSWGKGKRKKRDSGTGYSFQLKDLMEKFIN